MMRGRPMTVVTPDQDGPSPVVRHGMPWLLLVVMLGAGGAGHLAWSGSSALPLITAALAVITGGLAWLGWTVARARQVGPAGRAHVAGTVAAAGVWLLLAIMLGPFTRPVVDVWGLVGAALAVSWNLRLALHRSTREGREGREDDADSRTPRAAGRRFMSSLGIKGASLEITEQSELRAKGTLALTDGSTASDVQKHGGRMASALGLPGNAIRITANPDDASAPEITMTFVDVLNKVVPWPGPGTVGGTLYDRIAVGVYETGEILTKAIADDEGARSELVVGTSGAGKSSGSIVEFCELMTRREVALIVVDPVKGIQTFGSMAPALEMLIVDMATGRKFTQKLVSTVTARVNYLGAKGLKVWQPGCGLTFLVVLLEEASELLKDFSEEDIQSLLKIARSAGIALKVSLQRGSHDQIDTTTRGVLNLVSCYGQNAKETVIPLPDAVLDAGADPTAWGDRKPGCAYVTGRGISDAQAAVPTRTYLIEDDTVRLMAAHFGPGMTPLDQVTARALGSVWANRERAVDTVARVTRETLAAAGEDPGAVLDGEVISEQADQADQEEDAMNRLRYPVTEDDMGIGTHDPDPDITATWDEDLIPAGVDLEFGAPQPQATTEEARAAVEARIREFEDAGEDVITAPAFADLVGMRARSWFHAELKRLVKVGRLVETSDRVGEFQIVPSGDVDRHAA